MSQTEVQLIKDAVIVNADISNSAAIDVSKISGAMPLAGGTITGDVTFDGETAGRDIVFDRSDNSLIVKDDATLKIGTGGDLKFTHQSSDNTSLITEVGGGDLIIQAQDIILRDAGNLEKHIEMTQNGSVDIYHNGTKKFETTSSGVTVTGDLITTGLYKSDTAGEGLHNTATGAKFFSNNSNDTHLEHGSNAQVKLSFIATGSTYRGAVSADANAIHLLTGASGEQVAVKCIADGATELYHSGSKKLETTSIGVTTTGRVKLDVNSSTVFPTSFGNEAFLPYDHEFVIDNNTGGNQGSFAGIFFNAGADTDGSKVGTARITAEETGNYKADLIFSTRNTSFTQKMRIKADGKVGIGINPPLAQLHIKPPSNISQLLLEQNNATDGYALFQDGPNGGHLKFLRHINGSDTQKLLLRSDGGLCFGTDDAAANALDDYEEGTWTPVYTNAGGFSTDNSVGKYTKIGRVVNWVCQVAVVRDTSSASGTFKIGGLPFTSLNGATGGHGYAGCMGALFSWNIPNTAYQIGIRVPDNSSFIQFFANFDNAADSQISQPFDANKTIFGSLAGQYITG